jgi:hypothetical protein
LCLCGLADLPIIWRSCKLPRLELETSVWDTFSCYSPKYF